MIRLYKRKCKPGKKNKKKYTTLMLACKYRLPKVAFKLIETFGAECKPNCVSDDKNTALILACRHKMQDIATHIIISFSRNCNPGMVGEFDNTALIWACKYKLRSTALLLIDVYGRGCKYDHINKDDMTAVYWAYINRIGGVVFLLNNLYVEDGNRSNGRYIRNQNRRNTNELYRPPVNNTSRANTNVSPAQRELYLSTSSVLELSQSLIETNNHPVYTQLLNLYTNIIHTSLASNIINNKLDVALYDDIDPNGNITNKIDYCKRNTKLTCFVCYNIMKKPVMLTPCNHVGLCNKCANFVKLNDKKCPICRTMIKSIENIYIA